MAVPSYTTDLVDISTAESSTGWTEPTGFTAGTLAAETDYWIQSPGSGTTHCVSKSMGASAPASSGAVYTGGAVTIPSPGAAVFWLFFGAPNALANQASGGMQAFIGHAGTAFRQYYVRGSDTYTYGGWVCIPVDPAVTPNANTGSPNTSFLTFGGAAYIPSIAVSKGNPFACDVVRYGRCDARFANGATADGYATIAGFVTQNDLEANRWGLVQAVSGGYLWQGLMTLGYTNAVDFRDTNRNIFVADTQKVISTFNTIEVKNTASVVDMTNFSFTALGTTSKGRWITTDNANVHLTTCTFTDMDTFSFLANTTANTCTFRRTGAITLSNSHFTSCRVESSTVAANTSAVVWDNNLDVNGYLDGTTFVRGTTNNHALEFGTNSPISMTLTNINFSGYNAANTNQDSAIHIKRTTGTVTLNITGGSTPTVLSAGAIVVIVSGSVTATVSCKNSAGVNVASARVLLKASDATGPLPFETTVTIVNTSDTANVHHTGHGIATGDKVLIDGASLWHNNGVFTITKIDADYYNYTLPSAPGSSPTGTIKSTGVVLEGLADASGVITMNRVFASGQPVTGWVRKSSGSPYYKTAPLTGVVNNATGFSATAILISDE